jgi:hypothetical protein
VQGGCTLLTMGDEGCTTGPPYTSGNSQYPTCSNDGWVNCQRPTVLLVWSNFGWRSAHLKRRVHTGDGLLFVLAKDTLAVCEEMWRPGGEERLVAAV